MPQHIKLWTMASNSAPEPLPQESLDLEERLENWIEEDISLIDEDLLVIGRQVRTAYGGHIDLLCIDPEGDLVIIELKRDRTSRQVTAQALDYASWVVDLSHERISAIAQEYFGDERDTLEREFEKAFRADFPETINSEHRILIVASEVDPSTERIVEYLSGHHGVNINAVTFQYFSTGEEEILGRVFLLEPEEVEYKARTKGSSKRKPNLTREDLQEIAETSGVGALYRDAVSLLEPHFKRTRTTRSSISFVAPFRESRAAAMVNLIPEESSTENGLRFQIYALRVAEHFGVNEGAVEEALPDEASPWRYTDEGPEWEGFTGYFRSTNDIRQVVKLNSRNAGTAERMQRGSASNL